jgi:hypothetical protein
VYGMKVPFCGYDCGRGDIMASGRLLLLIEDSSSMTLADNGWGRDMKVALRARMR